MLAAVVPLALFSLLIWHLSFFWEVNPQYNYGWVVPGVAIYLFVRRWRSRPCRRPAPGWTWPALILCLIALGPIWLVREATPDWSVISWLLALTITATLLLVVCREGGMPWLSHFAFPILFMLSAVPWPQRIELALVQGLMRFVADAASEILNWIGIAALATGNLVRLPSGTVTIDEACSGIRSLQAMLMFALFLGEFRDLTLIRRGVLLAFAVVAALILNLMRTTALVFVVARRGVSTFEAWHVPAGYLLLISGLVLLSGLGFLLTQGPRPANNAGVLPSQYLPIRTSALFASVTMLFWLAAILGATELWYASNEKKLPHTVLEISWPETMPGFKEIAVPENVRQILLSSDGRIAIWRDGCEWSLFTFRWPPGRTATQSARTHRPETCLQASGAVLDRELEPVDIALGPANLRFKSYLFYLSGRPLFVFFTIWEEANRDARSRTLGQDWSGWSRIQRAFARERNLGQQSLEFALSGPQNRTEAVRLFKDRLPELIRCRNAE
jgi:exosortase